MSGWPWSELGLSGPAALPEIRHAYAQRLETTHPEDDPEGFQRLHSAYQQASRIARQQKRTAQTADQDTPAELACGQDASQETPPAGPGWNEALLRARERRGKQAKPLRDWEYERLLRCSPARPAHKAPLEQSPEPPLNGGWDYDALLHGKEEGAPSPAQETPPESGGDWDYDRLFAEGAAERARSAKQSSGAGQDQGARRAEASWARTEAALGAMEQLCAHGAPLYEWTRFLHSAAFLSVRYELDFIFGLEELLQRHPTLSKPVKRAVLQAYGMTRRPVQPEWQTLYKLLRAAPPVGEAVKRRRGLFGVGAALLWVLVILPILFSNSGPSPSAMGERQQERICAYLEEDFGRSFHALGGGAEYANLFAPDDEPDLLFLAEPDGAREKTAGRRGYETNYPEAVMKRKLQNFADEQGLVLGMNNADGYRGARGETPEAYLVELPLTGAGESITALGTLLAQAREEDWYQELTPEFQVFLCHRGLAFYDVVSTEEAFDGDYARGIYEENVGPMFCRYLVNDLGLTTRHFGDGVPLALKGEGDVEIDGSRFFWVNWENGGGKSVYYFLGGGTQIFCLPKERVDQGELTTLALYHGSLEVLTAESVDLRVVVYDHVDPA